MKIDESAEQLKHVVIFTDGAAVPNPGVGGYGVVLRFGDRCKELSGGYKHTTNNRMEMMAVIAGLEALKGRCRVTVHSDSQYVVDAINRGSALTWRANNWRMNQSGSKIAKNPDLWARLLAVYDAHEVEMVWVRGHVGIADNERCDVLAMQGCKQLELLVDEGFASADTPVSASNEEGLKSGKSGAKMTSEGQPCRKCGTPIVKRVPKERKVKDGQTYTYAWYMYCPGCKSMYMVEAAKQFMHSAIDSRHAESK